MIHLARVLLLIVIVTLSAAVVHAADPATDAGDFPTFGVQFTPPANAVSIQPAGQGRVAVYHLKNTNPSPAIFVEIAFADGKKLDQVSQSLAEKIKAEPKAAAITIGSEEAMTVVMPINTGVFTNRTVYFVVHDGWQYTFHGISTTDTDVTQTMLTFLKSVKFKPIQSPLDHLKDFYEKPLIIFDRFSINCPNFTRLEASDKVTSIIGMFDYSKKPLSNVLSVNIKHLQIGAKPFATLRDAYSENLEKLIKAPTPFVWAISKENSSLHVSKPMKLKEKNSDKTTTNRFCILEIAPGNFVQLIFVIASGVPDAQIDSYVDLTDRMLATVKLLPAPTTRP